MKILHISSARAFGGGERHLADLALALAARGHEIHVALAPRSPLYNELAKLPAEQLHTLRLRNALDIKSAMSLARLVRAQGIEIVHAHLGRDYTLAALACGRNPEVRFVITRHVLFPLKRLHAITLARVSRVIAVSNSVARSVLSQRLVPDHRVTVIHNGLDFKRFEAARANVTRATLFETLNLNPDRKLIGTVGDLTPLKGHEDFLRAAALIARQRADVDFIIIGADRSRTLAYEARLRSLIVELGLEQRVHLPGWLDTLGPFFCAVDVFVSASRTESFGLAIAEALASGVPTVATATEGARELISDQETGLLVSIGNVEALAQSALRLLEDSELRERLSASAQRTARERFSLERVVAETEEVYRAALSEKM